jgi:cellulose synthase (UDP-forming)
MLHALGYFLSVYNIGNKKATDLNLTRPQLQDFPSVAILIPARHEPKDVIENTLISCYNLAYPHKTIYLLDDSSDEKYKKEAEDLVQKYDVSLFRRTERHGAKAGIINDCLKRLTDKYVTIFDADQNPMPDFLSNLIPLLENDSKLAFVQTPQFYSNLDASRVSLGSNMQQSVFYEYICEDKSTSQAMICCGTNVVLRREALIEVGGLDESTVTEDFATSFKLHLKKWKSLYYNHVHTFGMGPEDLGAYFKQQNRWALGNVGVLRLIIAKVLRHPFALRLTQWFEYIITGSYYLIGWAYLFLVLCPIAYMFFNVPSFFMNPVVYSFTFIPYLLLSFGIFYSSMLGRYYSISHIFRGQALAFITLPVYIRASFFGLIGKKGTFQVTSKSGTHRISYFKLWPQIALWAVCLAGITWGLNRFFYERTPTSLVNVLWTAYHFILLSSIFYFNEEDLIGTCKMLKKRLIFEHRVLAEPPGFQQLSKQAWKICFNVFIPERIDSGKLLMCKVVDDNNEPIIFDAIVLVSSEKKQRNKGFETNIGVVTISEKDKERLKEAIKG